MWDCIGMRGRECRCGKYSLLLLGRLLVDFGWFEIRSLHCSISFFDLGKWLVVDVRLFTRY
jgi:hypothetical protein